MRDMHKKLLVYRPLRNGGYGYVVDCWCAGLYSIYLLFGGGYILAVGSEYVGMCYIHVLATCETGQVTGP